MPIAYRKNAPPGGGRQPRESSSTSRSRTMPGMPLNAGSMPNVARLCTCSVFAQPVRDHADTKMHALERLAAQHVPATMRAALLAMCGMHSMGSEWNARTVSERCARFRRPSVICSHALSPAYISPLCRVDPDARPATGRNIRGPRTVAPTPRAVTSHRCCPCLSSYGSLNCKYCE